MHCQSFSKQSSFFVEVGIIEHAALQNNSIYRECVSYPDDFLRAQSNIILTRIGLHCAQLHYDTAMVDTMELMAAHKHVIDSKSIEWCAKLRACLTRQYYEHLGNRHAGPGGNWRVRRRLQHFSRTVRGCGS